MGPGSVFIGSVFFHGMLPCSLRWGMKEHQCPERGIMDPHLVAFTFEVKSANVQACTLRTRHAHGQKEHTVQTELWIQFQAWVLREISQAMRKEGGSYRGATAPITVQHTRPTLRAAPQFGQSLTGSINWCVPVNQPTGQQRLSRTDNATENRPLLQQAVEWRPTAAEKAATATSSSDSSGGILKKKKSDYRAGKSLEKRVEGVDSSHSMSASMWNLLGQMTQSPTAAWFFSEFSQCFHQKKKETVGLGGCGICWHRLMREQERGGGEVQRDKDCKEREQKSFVELQRMDNSCCSSFPLWSGSTLVPPHRSHVLT